jgi:hypothetical protein
MISTVSKCPACPPPKGGSPPLDTAVTPLGGPLWLVSNSTKRGDFLEFGASRSAVRAVGLDRSTPNLNRVGFTLMLLDYPIHSISISGVRVAVGYGMGRRRLPWPLGGLIEPRPMGVSQDVKPPIKLRVLYNQTTV